MEKFAFVARQKSTRELERLRDYLHDASQTLEFEDPSKPWLDILSKRASVLWASIVECCAMLRNVGDVGGGEADGELASSDHKKEAKRVQEEFARIARFFVEKASQVLGGVGKEHSWFTALCAHPRACESWRREARCAARSCLSQTSTPTI